MSRHCQKGCQLTGICVHEMTAVLLRREQTATVDHCYCTVLSSPVVRHEAAVGGYSDTISVYPVFVSPCDGLIRPANCL